MAFYDIDLEKKMEKQLRYTMAYQWFCGFSAFEQTPDHSFFSRFRKQIGTKQLKYFK